MKVIGNRYKYFIISAVFFVLSLYFIFFSKLNLGIDMTGGIQMEYSYNTELNIEDIQNKITNNLAEFKHEGNDIINNVNTYKITGENTLVVVAGFDNTIEEKTLDEYKNNFKENLLLELKMFDSSVIESSYINIGKSFGDYIKNTAKLTLIIAIIAIAFYIAWAFSGVVSGVNVLSFSSITIITLFHDVIISSGLYIFASNIFPEFKIDTFFVTALLTILGYSINDTIVVFDRVRANLKHMTKNKMNLGETIDFSINETLRRSIYTSLTLLFVLITIFFFGPESISGFTLVMIFGTIIGTYSSIFVAAPMLYEINKNKKISKIEKSANNPEDKIVV